MWCKFPLSLSVCRVRSLALCPLPRQKKNEKMCVVCAPRVKALCPLSRRRHVWPLIVRGLFMCLFMRVGVMEGVRVRGEGCTSVPCSECVLNVFLIYTHTHTHTRTHSCVFLLGCYLCTEALPGQDRPLTPEQVWKFFDSFDSNVFMGYRDATYVRRWPLKFKS